VTEAAATIAPHLEVLGIRHHGPGSARAVRSRLDELQPDVVLVEGPSDADPVLVLAALDSMVPPVALLAYAADSPRDAAFWPFAVFSPEWQAISWAHRNGVPVRFCDLPASASLVRTAPDARVATDEAETEDGSVAADAVTDPAPAPDVRQDPLAQLASAGGYSDPERWWDDVIESRVHGQAPFDAIRDAMAELRATTLHPGLDPADEERREAWMRQTVRAAIKDGAQRIAVVCGAWHAPAVDPVVSTAAADTRVLRGLPKRKVALTWVPWTHSRLASASGYGAGITSPGWYHHLFTCADLTVATWLTRVAGVLRTEDLPVSSAHVIEATRLSGTLATMRGRGQAGLDEVMEATRSVMCDGDDVALELVTRRLVVGEAFGSVPESAPTVPLAADIAATAKRLRLKVEAARSLDLDLRNDTDVDRSRLFHRLRLLDIGWAEPADSQVRSKGTFRETWELRWSPELTLAVVEASVWGSTVATAASARVVDVAVNAGTLVQLARTLESALLADLPDAMPELLAALDAKAASGADVVTLMTATPSLVRSVQYGDVRGTDVGALGDLVDASVIRICAGLPAAVGGLDDDAASEMRQHIDSVHQAVSLLADDPSLPRWLDTLSALVGRQDLHGLVAGRVVRLLLGADRLTTEQAGHELRRALSVGPTPAAKAAWVEGFLAGGGLLLVHDRSLLALIDAWLVTLDDQEFLDVVPLLRRTFGEFAAPERRAIGQAVRRTTSAGPSTASRTWDVDVDRARPAIDRVAELLGVAR
jgi:hypothetical protein